MPGRSPVLSKEENDKKVLDFIRKARNRARKRRWKTKQSIIQKFGGYLIDYEGNLLREYKPDKNYKIKYLSIENTANQLIQDYKFFKLNDKR